MSKAKTIDRLELTRSKFKHLQHEHEHEQQQGDAGLPDGSQGLKECPNCGSKSLRLDGGCMSCLSCGWSACG